MVTIAEKEQMAKAAKERNNHVLEMHARASDYVQGMIAVGHTKSDIFLIAGLIKDIAERLD